jgi:hypothetical protein
MASRHDLPTGDTVAEVLPTLGRGKLANLGNFPGDFEHTALLVGLSRRIFVNLTQHCKLALLPVSTVLFRLSPRSARRDGHLIVDLVRG